MNRRYFLKSLATLPLLHPLLLAPKASAGSGLQPFRFAFGSCALSHKPQPVWQAVHACRPDLFSFLGDTIYADTHDMDLMRTRYLELARHPDFAPFRETVPVVGTWDDHDYGGNDFGGEYLMKHQSKELFLEFYNEPADSERRRRDGVYTSYLFGSAPYRVQIILLDMRWFRTPLKDDKDPTTYLPDFSPESSFLGIQQWQWLEAQLRIPAEVRIIGSSIQFASSEHRFEKWANFPLEKMRLLQLIDNLRLKNVLIVSGDVHFGELSKEYTPAGKEILDFTSSGLNRFQTSKYFANSRRFKMYDQDANFGLVTVDWSSQQMLLELRNSVGQIGFSHLVSLVK